MFPKARARGNRARANPPVSTTSAFEPITPPEITELNQKHAVIANIGGKCRVLYWEGDKAILQSFEDFRNRYSNRFIQDGTRRVPLGTYWLRHSERRQYDGLVFKPGDDRKEIGRHLNL